MMHKIKSERELNTNDGYKKKQNRTRSRTENTKPNIMVKTKNTG